MLLDQGAASSAVRMLRSAWEPELPLEDLVPLYCLWIRGLCQLGDLEHALVLAKRAASELPLEPDVLTALGNVHDLAGQLEQAHDAFARATDAEPGGSLQHYNLGAVLERLGREDEAELSYRRAIDLADVGLAFEATAALGALLRRGDRLEDAASVYEAYLDEDPINVDLLVEHGICLSDLESFEAAIERFQFSLSLEPEHSGALYNLAITLYRMGHYDDATDAMRRAQRADPSNPLTQAVLGAWLITDSDDELDVALGMLYGALDLLMDLDREEGISDVYAGVVVEEIFEALWNHGRRGEAREVARMAGQRDWITSHILDTLNEVDHGRGVQVRAYQVMARAEAGEAPEHWPENAGGYTTGLTVLATNEDEAREYTLEYLRSIEPGEGVHFDVNVVGPGPVAEVTGEGLASFKPRARGVVRVNGTRAYFR